MFFKKNNTQAISNLGLNKISGMYIFLPEKLKIVFFLESQNLTF